MSTNTPETDFSLYDTCANFEETSTYELMESYFNDPQHRQHKILTGLAREAAKENQLDPDSPALSNMCHRISVLMASNSISQYMGKMDSHRYFSEKRKADYVLFGDSITDWGPWVEFFSTKSLVNRGIAGDNTIGMLYRIKDILPLEPKRVFFLAGINDLYQGHSVDTVLGRYIQMLEFCTQNNIEAIVQSTLFVGKRLAEMNGKVQALNDKLQQYCQENKLNYIDLNSELSPDGILAPQHSQDDVHLTAKAYQKWANILMPWLEAK